VLLLVQATVDPVATSERWGGAFTLIGAKIRPGQGI